MSRARGADNAHVAFAMAIRRLELQYGLYIHASAEWIFISNIRPRTSGGVFGALHAPELAAAVEREVDAEPRLFKVRPS